MLALINQRRQLLLYPLDAQGQQTSYPIGAAYDQATGSYNRLGGETPGGQPLHGRRRACLRSGRAARAAGGGHAEIGRAA